MDNYKYDWVIFVEWIGTAIILVGVALTSLNIYPMNLYMGLLGNFAWIIVGWKWRKWSILVIETAIAVMYMAGIILA